MLYIFGLVMCFLISILVYYIRTDSKELGEAEESDRQLKELLNEAHRAKAARNSLINDPALRDKLREHYTRE